MVLFTDVITQIAFAFDILAVLFIVGGGIITVIEIARYISSKGKRNILYNNIRIKFVKSIIFGLGFLIAAGILRAIMFQSLDAVIQLGILVGITTILAYSLTKEVKTKL